MSRSSTLVTVLALGSLASGCCFGGFAPTPQPVAAPFLAPVAAAAPIPVAPPPPPPAPSAEELASIDVQPLIEHCVNASSERVARSRQRYFQWVDREDGPNARRNVYGLYSVSASEVPRCRNAVVEVAQRSPLLADLDASAAAYASALEAVTPLINQADAYYEREDYRDDDMARGREMHAGLIAAFDAFDAASRDLSARLDTISDAAREKRLETLAADPARRGEYLVERAMGQSQTLVRLLASVRVERRRLISDQQDELFAAITALRTGADQMYNERATAFASFRAGTNILGPINELASAAIQLMRRIRDGEALGSFELSNIGTASGWMIDGGPDAVLQKFNRLVDAYNRM